LEPLSDVVIRLYTSRSSQNVIALAVANPNHTLSLTNDDEIDAKASSLMVEAKTDANGNFSVELGAKQGYAGEAFEIDVYCGNVPHRKPGRKKVQPHQFSVTTLQPMWKQTADGEFLAIWQYCIPWRFWCFLRGLFDAWVICGRLTTCGEGAPIPGAVVSAFDVDWLQDDSLGSGTTDAAGFFRIDYNSSDFELTPFSPAINLEWVGGPDLYFTAKLGSTTILQEDRSVGRTTGRQNVGPCFCVKLCSDKVIGPPDQHPHWNKVWEFSITPDAGQVGSQFSIEGYAGGPASSFVFGDSNYRGGVLLRGNCPLSNIAAPANALQYRFVIGEYDWSPGGDNPNAMPSVAPTVFNPITQIRPTTVGYVYYTDADGIYGPGDVVITSGDLDATGWLTLRGHNVTVDMHNGTTAVVTITESNFLRTDELLVIASSVITAAHAPKLSAGLPKAEAGRALTNAEKEPIRRYQLRFEVREGSAAALLFTDTLSSIILDNSDVILAMDLEELRTNACNPLGGASKVHVLYTVDHPHLASFNLAISNNTGTVHGAPPMPKGSFLPGPNLFFRGGNSGPHNGTNTGGFGQDISMDNPCAYSLSLGWSTRRYLTSGGAIQVLYCKVDQSPPEGRTGSTGGHIWKQSFG
jgi:hypothetical protein